MTRSARRWPREASIARNIRSLSPWVDCQRNQLPIFMLLIITHLNRAAPTTWTIVVSFLYKSWQAPWRCGALIWYLIQVKTPFQMPPEMIRCEWLALMFNQSVDWFSANFANQYCFTELKRRIFATFKSTGSRYEKWVRSGSILILYSPDRSSSQTPIYQCF